MAYQVRHCKRCGDAIPCQPSDYKSRYTKKKFCSRNCSDRGRNLALEVRFWAKVKKTAGCWLWTASTRNGYGQIGNPGRKVLLAHRVSWELANGPIPDGMWVLHRCDNPPCVRPSHLFLGTPKMNSQDSKRKGRNNRGENHGHAKLTESMVEEILILRELGMTYEAMASRFPVGSIAIGKVVRGDNWSHTGLRRKA